MTELYDDETADNIIDKLCHCRQQPNESVRDFRARMKRVKVSLERAGLQIPPDVFRFFFLVKRLERGKNFQANNV